MTEKKGILLKCPHCGNVWLYKGTKRITAVCSDCMRRIKISECKTHG